MPPIPILEEKSEPRNSQPTKVTQTPSNPSALSSSGRAARVSSFGKMAGPWFVAIVALFLGSVLLVRAAMTFSSSTISSDGTMTFSPLATSTLNGNFVVNGTTTVNGLSVGTTTVPSGGVAFINGRMGIGTSTPAASLHIDDADAQGTPALNVAYSLILQQNGGPGWWTGMAIIAGTGGGHAQISFGDSTNDQEGGILVVTNGTSSEMALSSQGAISFNVGTTAWPRQMYIASTGNVGIGGTMTPSSTLSIKGGLAVGSSYVSGVTAPTNGAIIQGKVGIGTSVPSSTFQVVATNSSTATIGTASQTGCLELGSASGTATLVYVYFDSNATIYATTTKPNFCQ